MVGKNTLAASLRRWLTPERCEQLDIDGYVVLDESPLPEDMAAQFLAQIKKCFSEIDGGKEPNQVEFLTTEGAVKLTKPHIYECDLHKRHVRDQLPLFTDLFNTQLRDVSKLLSDRVQCCEDIIQFDTADEAASAVTLKLQMNEGGAFPWHYDNPCRSNKRRLTMAVYLTEGWAPGDGGELQVMPFLGPCITVPPRFNTIVLFRSDLALHRVLPVRSKSGGSGLTRYCFTVWFDGTATNTDEDQYLKVQHLREDAIPFLKRSPVQRTLSRAVYEPEYRQALMDCFGEGTVALSVSLQEHETRLRELMGVPKVREFVNILKEYREDVQASNSDSPT